MSAGERDASGGSGPTPAGSTPDKREGSLPTSSRYELLAKIASGGMATVYVGRLRGAVGFWRLCAIKRAHMHLVEDDQFRRMLIAEARLASRIHHPNVVAVLDVEELAGELRLVMDYVEGAALSDLVGASAKNDRPLPARIAIRIALDACAGLHAAHQLRDDDGQPLRLVHRDVSPQNILVGVDGQARIADFGIAKSARTSVSTTTGAIKGKLGYMSPEYVQGGEPDARSDVFAMGVVLWEALANQKLFRAGNEIDTLRRVVDHEAPLISSVAPWVGKRLDSVLAAALEKSPDNRFQTAQALGAALEAAARKDDLIATASEVGEHVQAVAGPTLAQRQAKIRERVASDPGEGASTTATHHRPAPAAIPSEPAIATGPPGAEASATSLGQPSTLEAVSSRSRDDIPASIPMRPRGLVGVGVVSLVVGVVVVGGIRLATSSGDGATSTATTAATAPASVEATTTPPAAPTAEPSPAPTIDAAAPRPTPSAVPSLPAGAPRPTAKGALPPAAATSARPTAAPTASTKKLPPNPYGAPPN